MTKLVESADGEDSAVRYGHRSVAHVPRRGAGKDMLRTDEERGRPGGAAALLANAPTIGRHES